MTTFSVSCYLTDPSPSLCILALVSCLNLFSWANQLTSEFSNVKFDECMTGKIRKGNYEYFMS